MRVIRVLLVAVAAVVWVSTPASAQSDRPTPVVEVSAARGAFLANSLIEHAVIGGAARWYVNGRVSIGPEITYMIGPGSDRDLFVTGNVTTDLLRSKRVTPYVLIGGGLFRHSETFAAEKYSEHAWALTSGGGFRIAVTSRLSIAPEFRVGWEPHMRLGVTVAYRL